MESIEIIISLRNEAIKKGLAQEDIETYIKWKLKFDELDIPMPTDTTDEKELQEVYDMFVEMKALRFKLEEEDDVDEDVEEEDDDVER